MKLYIVCVGCGEAFDDFQPAYDHGTDNDYCERGMSNSVMFVVLPESEAM